MLGQPTRATPIGTSPEPNKTTFTRTEIDVLRRPCEPFGHKICGTRTSGGHPHLSENRRNFAKHHAMKFWSFIRKPSRIPGDTFFEKAYALSVIPVVVPAVVLAGSILKIARALKSLPIIPHAERNPWEISRFEGDQGRSDCIRARDALKASLLLNDIRPEDDSISSQNKFNYYAASYLACFCSVAYSAADKIPPASTAPTAVGPSAADNTTDGAENTTDRAESTTDLLIDSAEKSEDPAKETKVGIDYPVLKNAPIRKTDVDDAPRGLGYNIVYDNGDILIAFKGTSFDFIHQEHFIGSTVLYVMVSQALATFPDVYACKNYKMYDAREWKNCLDCDDCRINRTRERRRLTWTTKCDICGGLWQDLMKLACKGCTNFMKAKFDRKDDPFKCTNKKAPGKHCFRADCGQCDKFHPMKDCNKCPPMTDCEKCNKRRKYWPWIVLRDCYTFASPKVGDTEFARAFDKNQRMAFKKLVEDRVDFKKEWQAYEDTRDDQYAKRDKKYYEDLKRRREMISSRSVYSWPAYWRIANELDPVPKAPIGLESYSKKKAVAGNSEHHGSLLDYQHIGYLVQLPSDTKQSPIITPPFIRQRVPDVKCAGCQTILPVFPQAGTVVACPDCSMELSKEPENYGIFEPQYEKMALHDVFEKYEGIRIDGSLETPQRTNPTGFLSKIRTLFRPRLRLSSHRISEYSGGLLSAEKHFTTYVAHKHIATHFADKRYANYRYFFGAPDLIATYFLDHYKVYRVNEDDYTYDEPLDDIDDGAQPTDNEE
ncbi:hypothetical protein EC968_007159 [Mortierella alpina]|nr:hypothetical protein EC968_007159 [Mortierella alpina]